MGEAEMDVVRDQYAATNERDWSRAMSHYAEDVVLSIPEDSPYLTSGTFSGRDAVGEWFGDWFRSFDSSLRFEITELTELEDGSVLLVADYYVRGRASGIELKDIVVWRYRLREGKIASVEGHPSRQDALRAASRPG
jgi:ketosteroid isomerase-like protein